MFVLLVTVAPLSSSSSPHAFFLYIFYFFLLCVAFGCHSAVPDNRSRWSVCGKRQTDCVNCQRYACIIHACEIPACDAREHMRTGWGNGGNGQWVITVLMNAGNLFSLSLHPDAVAATPNTLLILESKSRFRFPVSHIPCVFLPLPLLLSLPFRCWRRRLKSRKRHGPASCQRRKPRPPLPLTEAGQALSCCRTPTSPGRPPCSQLALPGATWPDWVS